MSVRACFMSGIIFIVLFSCRAFASEQQSNIVDVKGLILQTDLSLIESKPWLFKQLNYAQLLHRPDITDATLKRLFAIDPNDAQGLSFKAQDLAVKGNIEEAIAILKKLQKKHLNTSITKKLKEILSIHVENKSAYQKAILLSRSGRSKEALHDLNTLFPDGMPSPSLTLIYLNIAAQVDGHEKQVIEGLKALNEKYPGVADFQLAYASYVSKKDPGNIEALQILKNISLDPRIGIEATSVWYSRLNDLPITQNVVLQYAILSNYYQSNSTYHLAWIDAKARFQKSKYYVKILAIYQN